MNAEEIRKKAIECRKLRIDYCESHVSKSKHFAEPCTDCAYYEHYSECSTIFAYEHGFADGVKEGKRQEATWIPVTERLPEEFSKSYMVCLQNGHIDIATKMYDGRLAFICEHGVREACNTNPIIAWMPLPEPFEKEQKE